MIAFLVSVAVIIAYLVAGTVYARSQALACYRQARQRAEDEWVTPAYVVENTRKHFYVLMWTRLLLWPFASIMTGGGLFMGPVLAEQEKARQLRADAAAWRKKQHVGSPSEREMAAELARMCEEQAEAVDI